MTEKLVKVYGMRAPAMSPDIRYVGITTQPMERRLSQHWSSARRGDRNHRATWMRSVLAAGHSVEMVLLEEVPEAEWQEAERRHIAQYENLTNATAGGEGMLDPTPETRERMRLSHLGKKQSHEQVEKVRARMMGNKHGLGHKQSPEHVAKALAGRMGKSGKHERTPEIRARMSAAKIGHKQSLETRMKRSESVRRTHSNPEVIEKIRRTHLGRKRSEETKAKMRQAALGRQFSEETRAKMSEAAKRRCAAAGGIAVGTKHG